MAISVNTTYSALGVGGSATIIGTATEGRFFLTTGTGAAYGGMVGFAIDPTYGTDNVAVFFQQNAGPMVTAVPQGEEGTAWEIAIFSGDLQDNTSYQFNYHVKTFEPETQPGQ